MVKLDPKKLLQTRLTIGKHLEKSSMYLCTSYSIYQQMGEFIQTSEKYFYFYV